MRSSDLLQSTEGSACRPACWSVGIHRSRRASTTRPAQLQPRLASPPHPARLPPRLRGAAQARTTRRPPYQHASRRRQARPPVFAIPSGTACPKSPKTSRKLCILFPARVAQGRGEEKRQRLTSPMAASSLLRATCVSRLSSRVLCSGPSPLVRREWLLLQRRSALARLAGASRLLRLP
jgi:hypothetical protein